MATYKGFSGFLAIGGAVVGSPRTAAGYASGIATINVNAAGSLTGIIAIGDIFTISGETGTPNHTVTGGPFYVATGNAFTAITFTPAIATNGVASNAAITYPSNAVVNARSHGIVVETTVLDITHLGDVWEAKEVGEARWTGTGECQLDYGDARQAELIDSVVTTTPSGSVAAVLFGNASAKQFYGGVILTNLQVVQELDAIVTVRFTMTGNGALLPRWD